CIQDEDETDIDCGGSCPPCQHAPSHKSYNTNTSPDKPLPSETYAISSITAGNASVKVYSGQNASFYSVGTINLKDGFHAEPGSNFFAQPKSMRLQATADCQAFCDPVIYNTCTREPGNPNGYNDTWYWEITNAKSVSVILDQYDGFNHSVIMDVYSNTFVPSQDGEVMLWNLEDGTPCYESSCRVSGSVNGNCNTDHHLFYYHVTILSCQDIPFEYTGSLFVLNTVCTKKLLSSSVNSAERNANMQAIFNQDELEYVSSIEKGLIVQNNDLQVYPNPAKDQITVSYKFTGDSYAEIIIYDVNGKELMKEKLTNEHNTNLISIDISSFTNGVYFLTLQSKTSSQKTKFIVLKQ
ncbi:MAG: T9SS type A sorting domain-containing protein, partial [Bacteroidales bacterium]